jgi:hypothetical protein
MGHPAYRGQHDRRAPTTETAPHNGASRPRPNSRRGNQPPTPPIMITIAGDHACHRIRNRSVSPGTGREQPEGRTDNAFESPSTVISGAVDPGATVGRDRTTGRNGPSCQRLNRRGLILTRRGCTLQGDNPHVCGRTAADVHKYSETNGSPRAPSGTTRARTDQSGQSGDHSRQSRTVIIFPVTTNSHPITHACVTRSSDRSEQNWPQTGE